ncbi:2-octaprenyl-3-methyl-6-methoxy-1,4-benzoquinol hydroxylase [Faunimonas pinastri]|uniref:2-octaprenyl-3-methyl-6-methoxy-1,4-benzoquinol hydroxylase n=1 Tax=Faunimonas pinastri TaxID=1855383 RepID=A0A1H9GU94_9HYPH|nr:ubiquinone biosynthesis hydroxylase [Faunimonas pinastri]SEQ53578.1 2-octaprenyl-3-methyl-6-methoxy-1,4-benzoquinol hydroxylase [Faunimonas pinastri]
MNARSEAAEPDILIAGGGSNGVGAALAIASAAPDLRVQIVDAAPPVSLSERGAKDERASAIAAAARRMLQQLGAWNEIEPHSQPILSMEVTDSRTSDVARPVFLTFGGEVTEGEPFGHMVPNGVMARALQSRAEAAGVVFTAPDRVSSFTSGPGRVEVKLASGETRRPRLLIAADGVRSRLRTLAGIKTVSWQYGQTAIVCTVRHERPHNGVAIEHFLPSGPFAILPLTGNRSSLVWSERAEEARRLIEGDEFVFQIELERRFGHRLGAIEVEGPRQGFPLGLTIARDFVRPRFALLGDAAHGIHPIAGQGLNLGLRDVAALAETLVEAHRLGLDLGSLDVLKRYERWRRFDTFQMGVTTDVLNRLFSNDSAPVRAVRDFGLSVVDRLPRMKRMFIGEAAGLGASGDLPRLLQGEAI